MIGSKAVLRETLELIEQPLPVEALRPATPVPFEKSLKLTEVRFRFDEAVPLILDGVDLEIRKGARIAIVGKTDQASRRFSTS